mmetsp:Transcript_21016/g.27248  ORF Transcript_21016/g.27248 Transcript_21016/m.27248 type:complete len:287 (-) Transcript_21016:230-1090(-)
MAAILEMISASERTNKRSSRPERSCELCARSAKIAKTAYEIGYDVVALDFRIDADKLSRTCEMNDIHLLIQSARAKCAKKLLARATIILESSRIELPRSLLKSFDLIAICPKSEAAFKQACTTNDVDIITIECSQQLPFALHRAPLLAARKRSACFELSYDMPQSTSKRHLVSLAARLADACHGKGVILSGGNQILSPIKAHELAESLGFISQPHLALHHAALRRRPTWIKPTDLGLDDIIFADDESIQKSRASAEKSRRHQIKKRKRFLYETQHHATKRKEKKES